jgi:hypothetical protein
MRQEQARLQEFRCKLCSVGWCPNGKAAETLEEAKGGWIIASGGGGGDLCCAALGASDSAGAKGIPNSSIA